MNFLNKTPNLSLEFGVQLKLEIKDVNLPLESSLVGTVEGFIIITTPSSHKLIEHKLFKGNELIVRYLCNGTVYAFLSKLHASIVSPVRLLFIEYPQIIQSHELRSNKRANCFVPSVMKYGGKYFNGAILDITTKGCRFIVQADEGLKKLPLISVDEELLINCKFPGVQGQVPLQCMVRNVRATKKELDLGMAFSGSITPDARKVVQWYVSTIQDYQNTQKEKVTLP